jgi:hypothetical protein
VAHFQIPLDLPHAGRLAQRIVSLLDRHLDELEVPAPRAMEAAEKLESLLLRYSELDDNPGEPEATQVRDEAASQGRKLVDELQAADLTGDRIGQLVRNLFECLELGEEGAEISLRAGENPNSLQRPV